MGTAVKEAVMAAASRGGTLWSGLAQAIGYDTAKGIGANLSSFLASPTFISTGASVATTYLIDYAKEQFGITVQADNPVDWAKLLKILANATKASEVLGDPFARYDEAELEALRQTVQWCLDFFGSEAEMLRAHLFLQSFFEYDKEAIVKALRLLSVRR